MNKRNLMLLLVFLILLTISNNIYSQESLEDFLYKDFKEIENFGYIGVKVQGEQAFLIGLNSEELTSFARLKYKNNFAYITFQEIPAEEAYLYQEEEQAKKVGSIWFRVWTTGDDFPIAYYVECRAGSYKNYELWHQEALGCSDIKGIKQIIRNEITRMIESLAIAFFKARGEI
jgi:hypothetical protein